MTASVGTFGARCENGASRAGSRTAPTGPRPTIGLDIGGTKTLAALLAPDGEVLAQTRLATEPGPDAVVAVAVRAVRIVAAQAGIAVADLEGVGAGIPGLVSYDDGTVQHAVNVGIVEPLALAQRLGDELGVGVVVDNDLNVAALGAAHLEPSTAGRPVDMAFLSLGTGLAAGLVLDGVVRRGSGGAGEIGHVPVDPAGPLCACGQHGCLELYASGTAVSRLWPTTSDRPAPVELFEAAARGNPAAIAARDTYADAVAAAVRMLALSVDVDRVVLGGGVAHLGRPLLDAVRAALVRQADVAPFLRYLDLADRVRLMPDHVPVAAVGAAVLARASGGARASGLGTVVPEAAPPARC